MKKTPPTKQAPTTTTPNRGRLIRRKLRASDNGGQVVEKKSGSGGKWHNANE